MRKLVTLSVLSLSALFLGAGSAEAASVGFTLRLTGVTNPIVKIVNKSDTAEITSFVMTIGDTAYNFDRAFVHTDLTTPGIDATLLGPDDIHNGVRSDFVSYAFNNFSVGSKFFFQTDVDIDNQNSAEDYKNILFHLDGSDTSMNSLVTVQFSDGTELSQQMPNWLTGDVMRFTLMGESSYQQNGTPPAAVPLPAAAWSGISLLAGMGVWGRFRKKQR